MHLLYIQIKNGVVLKNILDTFIHNCNIIKLNCSSDGILIAEKADEIEIETKINSKKFCKYHYGFKQNKKAINFNLKHATKILKNIKKKQLLEIFIFEDDPNFLHFKIYNSNFISTNSLKILSVDECEDVKKDNQNLPIKTKSDVNTTIIKSNLFVKSLKEILQLSTNLDIIVEKNQFHLSTRLSGVYEKKIAYKLSETSKKNKIYTFQAPIIKSLLKSNNLSQYVFISFHEKHVNLVYKNEFYNLNINLIP